MVFPHGHLSQLHHRLQLLEICPKFGCLAKRRSELSKDIIDVFGEFPQYEYDLV
jgi:hypothetical protein